MEAGDFMLVSARHFKIVIFLLFTGCFVAGAQEKDSLDRLPLVNSTRVDSLLNNYYLDGVRDFIAKLGVLSVKQKNVRLKRKDFNDRLIINIRKSLILNKNDFSVIMQYKLNPSLYLKGQSVRSLEGTRNSVNIVYKLEYE